MKLTVFIEIDVETNDQPVADVRARLAHAKNRVGEDIGRDAKLATKAAMWVAWPDTYFPNWPKDGRLAEVTAVRQRTRIA